MFSAEDWIETPEERKLRVLREEFCAEINKLKSIIGEFDRRLATLEDIVG